MGVQLVDLVKESCQVLIGVHITEGQVGGVAGGLSIGAFTVTGDTEGQVHRGGLDGQTGLDTIDIGERDILATELVLLYGSELDVGGLEGLSGEDCHSDVGVLFFLKFFGDVLALGVSGVFVCLFLWADGWW
ncbi:hypothetical protein FR483_n350L [Paramecium bursaria Chlorella virus FR483]|uniref:Uncharacterized protein n350L n=1 Tax=Paramecium bursaria Chlorella virus FR483 TaxID=399781 RepID=A7J754_PBCVF|nr:hypothetical protein FR483_n350L [Paramecium bursaria Chlorella virus FR483]ABT15635.1 hypothetical protein FR483_n350L [Paramecium bursaria Chlorella virus FR483]